jgi:hypothetical protein
MIAQCGHQLKAGVGVEFFAATGEGTETGAAPETVGPASRPDQISPLESLIPGPAKN